MANATWMEATNEALEAASLPRIDTVEDFNTSGNLEKYQAQAKQVIKLANSLLGVRMDRNFTNRRVPLPLTPGTAQYALDVGCAPESIKVNSFFNVTADPTLKNQNGMLFNWEYRSFKAAVPDESVIPSGPPQRWILLPIERTDLSPVWKVQIYPTPNAAYQLQFTARVNPYQLIDATSPILFPPEYQHCLTLLAWELIERGLGEGKEGRIGLLAERAAAEVRLIATQPEPIRKAPRTMRLPSSRVSRWYSSPPSVDPATGAVIE